MSDLPMLRDPCRSASGWLDTLGRHVGVSVWAHTPLDFLDGFSPVTRTFIVALHVARVAVEAARAADPDAFPDAWTEVERSYAVARVASHHAAPFHGAPLGRKG